MRSSVGSSMSVTQRHTPLCGRRITVIVSVFGSKRPIWFEATMVNQTMSSLSTRTVCG